ncbi:MAG: hypothetical protein FWG14_03905 [Peptococcaceae bacterium]|nr:hypothetical protein [Peptococcaceae bacterium]
MLTQERADILSAILNANAVHAQTLLSIEPSEALRQINALGNDFELDELNEYRKALQVVSTQGEIDAEALDYVVGGAPIANLNVRPLAFPVHSPSPAMPGYRNTWGAR